MQSPEPNAPERSPQELRVLLSSNLRILTKDRVVSKICQTAKINRTQFNRYLSGESFPRPDILDRICRYFEVDANILLRPLGETPETPERIALRHAILAGRFDFAGDMPLSLMAVRAFPKTDTARCVLAQCAGTVRHGEFQMLAAEAGFAGLQPDPTAILSDVTETPITEPFH
jgi:transcriptional regulator with XRE-family HTH domain